MLFFRTCWFFCVVVEIFVKFKFKWVKEWRKTWNDLKNFNSLSMVTFFIFLNIMKRTNKYVYTYYSKECLNAKQRKRFNFLLQFFFSSLYSLTWRKKNTHKITSEHSITCYLLNFNLDTGRSHAILLKAFARKVI